MKIHEFGVALFGEYYSANQFAKILVNRNGELVDRKTVQNWIYRETDLPEDIILQLKNAVNNRKKIIENLINSY